MEFKVKNRCKKCERSKSRTFTVVIFLFEGNKLHYMLETNRTKL